MRLTFVSIFPSRNYYVECNSSDWLITVIRNLFWHHEVGLKDYEEESFERFWIDKIFLLQGENTQQKELFYLKDSLKTLGIKEDDKILMYNSFCNSNRKIHSRNDIDKILQKRLISSELELGLYKENSSNPINFFPKVPEVSELQTSLVKGFIGFDK